MKVPSESSITCRNRERINARELWPLFSLSSSPNWFSISLLVVKNFIYILLTNTSKTQRRDLHLDNRRTQLGHYLLKQLDYELKISITHRNQAQNNPSVLV